MRQVSFYMSDPSIEHILNIDPDRDWRYFGNGVVIWIAQTFLRLRNCGAKVALTSTPPNDGVVVLHADDLPSYVAANGRRNRCFVVCVRADRNPNPDTDLEIVQNLFLEQSNRTKYIPHWPQPGLKSRVRERGTLVQNITFKGYPAQLHEMFRTLHWQRFLKLHKLRWNEDSATWTGKRLRLFSEMNWNDYSESDVLIAVRPNKGSGYPNKPACKLTNAWAAGTPAILGPEVAYRGLKTSDLDYLEAASFEEVGASVELLIKSPDIYPQE